MELREIQEEVQKILTEQRLGTLTTLKGDQPYSRFMICRYVEPYIYMVSSKKTEKVQDILTHPKVHILLGTSGAGMGKPYLEMTAIATIHTDKELKDRLWHENFLKYLTGPDDPNYTVIRCELKTVRLVNHPELKKPVSLTEGDF